MIRILLSIVLVALTWSTAPAQTEASGARDYFNRGAQLFANNQLDEALAVVNEGIERHPESAWLPQLKEAIEREKQQQQQSGGDSSQQPQPQENEENQQQQEDQQQPDQPLPDEQPEDEQDQKDKENEGEQKPEPGEQPQPEPQPVAEEMTEQEAEMVLDSLRQLEEAQRDQVTREMIRRTMQNLPPVEKDW